MSAGNVNTPAALWERDRLSIPGPWPEALVVLDLRFWADPIACGRAPRPSHRELAAAWGWHPSRVTRLLQKHDASEAAAKQQRSSSEAGDQASTPETSAQRSSSEAAAKQQRSSEGVPLDTRARRLSSPSLVSTDVSLELDAREPPPAPVPPPAPPRPAVDPAVVAQLIALQEDEEPQHGMTQERDRSALERALGRGVTLDRLLALWAWSAVSDDSLVAGCRNGRGWRRWSSLLKAPDGEARLDAAWAWHVAGRPTPQPRASGPPTRAAPRASPPKPATSGRSILDALADLEATGFALPGDPR